MIQHVVWDWNGTLLDDLDVCLSTLNSLLADRDMPAIGRDHYRAHFGFPVRDFYLALGFDLQREDFEQVSTTFMDRYRARIVDSAVHVDVHDTLTRLATRGIRQHVVSAMEERMLHGMLTEHAVAPHMERVRGLDHLHATSKVDLGVGLARELGCPPDRVLFVGDTLHDHETATAMGCHCVLFSGGHQDASRFAMKGVRVIHQLSDIHAVIDAHQSH